jgi:hypothetical protein
MHTELGVAWCGQSSSTNVSSRVTLCAKDVQSHAKGWCCWVACAHVCPASTCNTIRARRHPFCPVSWLIDTSKRLFEVIYCCSHCYCAATAAAAEAVHCCGNRGSECV